MKDGIIAETKNSRLVKADLPGTYEEFKALAAGNGVPIDLLFNALGWSQIPDFLNKSNLLQDQTCDLLELPHTATVNDAFLSLVLPTGKYAVKVTVLSPGGRPMRGIEVHGLSTTADKPVYTNENGTALGFTTNASATLTAVNTRFDLSGNASTRTSLSAGVINQVEIKFTRGEITQKTFESSQKIQFSPDVDTFDCSAVGGGQNGEAATFWGSDTGWIYGGAGGNAGAVANKAGVQNTEQEMTITVGGVNGTSSVSGVITAPGGGGAKGGAGARARTGGENAKEGANTLDKFLYPPTEVGGAGGGGEAGNANYNYNSAAGGTPGGGHGASYIYTFYEVNGKYPGSGGGGGAIKVNGTDITQQANPGTGKAGLVGIMWRYKA